MYDHTAYIYVNCSIVVLLFHFCEYIIYRLYTHMKCIFVPFHATKVYRMGTRKHPLILNLGTGLR